MRVFTFIFKNLGTYATKFWLALVAGLINSFAGVAIPLLLATFTAGGLSSAAFTQLAIWLVTAILIVLASSWYLRRFGETVAYQFPNHIRLTYFTQLERLPIDQLAKHHTGYILSMVNQISSRIAPIMMDMIWTFTGVVANIGLLVYFTATKSWGLTVLNLLLFVLFVVISTLLARNMTRLADVKNKKDAIFSQYYIDFMGNLLTIKRLGIRDFATYHITKRSHDSNAQIDIFQRAHANRWLLLHSVYFTANVLTIGYLLYLIAHSAAPVSLLILFVSFYGNIRYIIERVAENIITFTETRVYINNLDDILAGGATPHRSQKPSNHWQHITLQDVTYRHADNAATIQIPQLSIRRGDKVCIYGTSGEGKTTALNIIANFLATSHGTRQVDDTDYSALSRTWFADHAAFISQETELFNISLKDNLTLGQSITDDRLWGLLADLQLADWVHGLEHGLDTVVGEKGLRLSAGQKQRVNLARGILLDRDIYFLDEPTSHLDDATEKTVVAAINAHLKDKTMVVVTHRPAIKKVCNQFYRMNRHIVTKASS